MTRVLVLLKYSAPGSPQDQQRGAIYAPLFHAAGIDVRYIARYPYWLLGRGRPSPVPVSLGVGLSQILRKAARAAYDWLNDLRIAWIARDFDVVLLIKVDTPSLIQKLRRSGRARLVYDLADVRQADADQGARINEILAGVDAITVDNPLGIAYARKHGRPVYLWPPVAYVEAFDSQRATSRRGRDGRIVIGWIGTPTTASNLYLVLESLEDIFQRHPNVEVRLVGLPEGHDLLRRFEHVRASCRPTYEAASMVAEVVDMDIGLFPMFDLQDAAMHGTTKALIYMGGGAVAICSPVGEIMNLIRDGKNGMLASGRAEWTAKMEALISGPALRARLSDAALRTVRGDYSLERCFSHLRRAIGV